MNPSDPRHPWSRLTAAARQVDADCNSEAPYGFATRVAALAWHQKPVPSSLFAQFALRAVGVAALLAVLSFALNYSSVRPGAVAMADDDTIVNDDGLAIVMEIAGD